MSLLGLYDGTVEDDKDPELVGRMKVRCPAVHGPANAATNSIATSDLPWARPLALPAGGTQNSGSIAWLPVVGDHVAVMFLDGEPEKPRWMWSGQDDGQAKNAAIWTRQPGGYQPDGTAPKSAVLERFGHSLDFQPDTLTLRTASGFKIRFTESTQQLDIYAPNMKFLIGSLKLGGNDIQFNPSNSFGINSGNVSVNSTKLATSALTTTMQSLAATFMEAPHIELGPSGKATDPVVRLSDVISILVTLITWANLVVATYNTHTHIGNLGHPTSPPLPPPLIPLVIEPTASMTTFTA